ncbi:hypothetical protein J6590_030423 [Homalodisca vitripennis]|nr:hypothetical protein J6590_030423 [Homalodisca vitripennis]
MYGQLDTDGPRIADGSQWALVARVLTEQAVQTDKHVESSIAGQEPRAARPNVLEKRLHLHAEPDMNAPNTQGRLERGLLESRSAYGLRVSTGCQSTRPRHRGAAQTCSLTGLEFVDH